MAAVKFIPVTESISELKKLMKDSIPMISTRIRVILEMKRAGDHGISKRSLAENSGVDPNSVQKWRKMYEKGGLKLVCSHNKTGFKPSKITKDEHKAIEKVLTNPRNGLQGYKELMEWVEAEFGKEIKYNTLLKYCLRHFKTKVKVGRKSHFLKNEEAVDLFKKTSLKSAGKSVKIKRKHLKK